MPMHNLGVASWLGLILSGASVAYLFLAVVASLLARRRRGVNHDEHHQPPMTILKPLCGDEPCLYEALRSFCVQDYPQYQIIFGVHDGDDKACHTVEKLKRELPEVDIKLVVDGRIRGKNLKVSNLANILRFVRYEHIVVADSDVIVERDYLRSIAALMQDPGVGLVTCMYRSRALDCPSSRFGALFIDSWFMPAVRVSRLLGVTSYVSGVTIALRREVLSRIGDFDAVTDCLADDYMMGEAVRRLGLKTRVAPFLVETVVSERTLYKVARHELRWMSTIRSVQPIGYAFSCITCGIALPLLGLVLGVGSPALVYLLFVAGLLRLTLHFLSSKQSLRGLAGSAWLIPARDLMIFCVWFFGFFSRTVSWREKAVAVSNI